MWITQVGDTARSESFAAFRAAVHGAAVEVDAVLGATNGVSKGFAVRYQSPTEGELRFSWDGPLTVKGDDVPISDYPRFDNAWAKTAFEGKVLEIRWTATRRFGSTSPQVPAVFSPGPEASRPAPADATAAGGARRTPAHPHARRPHP